MTVRERIDAYIIKIFEEFQTIQPHKKLDALIISVQKREENGVDLIDVALQGIFEEQKKTEEVKEEKQLLN